jgi:hypothetical protein
MALVKQFFTRVKQALKMAACCSLCFVMIVLFDYKQPVQVHAAFVGPVAVEVDVAVASALAALGIGVSGNVSTPDWFGLIHKIGDSLSDKMGGVTAEQYGDAVKYHLSHDFLQSVSESFGDYVSSAEKASALTSAFPSTASLSQSNLTTPLTIDQFYSAIGCPYQDGHQYTGITSKITGYTVLAKVFYSWTLTYCTDDIAVNIAGKKYWFMNSSGGNSGQSKLYAKTGTTWNLVTQGSYDAMQMGSGNQLLDGYLVAFMFQGSISPEYYLINTAGASANTNLYYFPTYQYLLTDSSSGAALPMNDAQAAHFFPSIYAQGASVLTQPAADVQSKLDAKAGEKDSTGAYTGDVVSVPADANTKNPSKLRDATSTQTKVVGQDVADETDKTADDTYNQTNSKDTTPPKSSTFPDLSIPSEVFHKFPFCLPWDLYASLVTLQATAAPPKFTVPFLHKADWGLNLDITLDMSQFESVAVVCRWGFSIMWIIGLIFLTRKLIWK